LGFLESGKQLAAYSSLDRLHHPAQSSAFEGWSPLVVAVAEEDVGVLAKRSRPPEDTSCQLEASVGAALYVFVLNDVKRLKWCASVEFNVRNSSEFTYRIFIGLNDEDGKEVIVPVRRTMHEAQNTANDYLTMGGCA
jgi:hypothetical protein